MDVAREEHVTRAVLSVGVKIERKVSGTAMFPVEEESPWLYGALPGRKSETSQVSSGSCCDARLAGPGKPLSEHPPPLQGVLRSP